MEVKIKEIDRMVADFLVEGVEHIDDKVKENDEYLPDLNARIEGPYTSNDKEIIETCSVKLIGDKMSMFRLAKIISDSSSGFEKIHNEIEREFGKEVLEDMEKEEE